MASNNYPLFTSWCFGSVHRAGLSWAVLLNGQTQSCICDSCCSGLAGYQLRCWGSLSLAYVIIQLASPGFLTQRQSRDPRSRREHVPVLKYFSNLSPMSHVLLSHSPKWVPWPSTPLNKGRNRLHLFMRKAMTSHSQGTDADKGENWWPFLQPVYKLIRCCLYKALQYRATLHYIVFIPRTVTWNTKQLGRPLMPPVRCPQKHSKSSCRLAFRFPGAGCSRPPKSFPQGNHSTQERAPNTGYRRLNPRSQNKLFQFSMPSLPSFANRNGRSNVKNYWDWNNLVPMPQAPGSAQGCMGRTMKQWIRPEVLKGRDYSNKSDWCEHEAQRKAKAKSWHSRETKHMWP